MGGRVPSACQRLLRARENGVWNGVWNGFGMAFGMSSLSEWRFQSVFVSLLKEEWRSIRAAEFRHVGFFGLRHLRAAFAQHGIIPIRASDSFGTGERFLTVSARERGF